MKTLILILAFCLPTVALAAEPSTYQPGDIFATRNATEEENSSPGHWNHTAVYVGRGLVVEAQIAPGRVIYSDLSEFIARYPEILVLRLRMGDGQVLADDAWRHVGTPYKKLASLPRRLRPTDRGNNCVSVCRRAFIVAVGRDPRWRVPDEVVGDPSLEILWGKGQ